jgi:copper chaperone CopZ
MRLRLDLDGLIAVHAARAAYTALASLEGVSSVEMERDTAWVEHDGRIAVAQCADALAVVGLTIRSHAVERSLPTL